MGELLGIWKYLSRHIWPAVLIAVAAVLGIAMPVANAVKFVTLPLPWPIFMAAGFAIFMVAVILILYAADKAQNSKITVADEQADNKEKVSEPTSEVEPFGSAILGGPLSGTPSIPHTPAPERTDPASEHPDKQRAKEALVPLAKDYFEPAWQALRQLRLAARDNYLGRMKRNTKIRDIISRAIDHGPKKASTRHDPAEYHELKRIDKVRALNLYEAETAFYHHYIDYGQNVQMIVSLVDECRPWSPDQLRTLLERYREWHDAHLALVERQKVLGQQFLDLNTIGTLEKNVLQEIPEPDWNALEQRFKDSQKG